MLDRIRNYRQTRYVEKLVRSGLKLGKNVYLNDGFFLDPSHCHLITIEDQVVFGPSVRVFAHDASSLKVIGKTRVGLVHLRKNCFIGGGTTILPGVTVGENSIVGAGAVVTADIPDGELWAGAPARRLMSVAEYREKLLKLPQVDFSEELYAADVISAERKLEMQEKLREHGVGFMKRG
ncbi:MAG: acyltransferase [Bdellovibrionota bacterium]